MEPIWKRATAASNPALGWDRKPQFLIDCASREGMSGAPVITYSKNGDVQIGGLKHLGEESSAILHGIYVGRIIDSKTAAEERLFEAQIGTVWKRQVIDDIIDSNVLGIHSAYLLASPKDIEATISKILDSSESLYLRVIENEYCRYQTVNTVLTELNGNANPDDVLNAITEHAKQKLSASLDPP